MNAIPLAIPDVFLLEPKVFGDSRGFFLECWNEKTFQKVTGLNVKFVQDNHSCSKKGVLRGLHYQTQQPQGKLVRVTIGTVLDVAVDLRKSSAYYGQHISVELDADTHKQLWVPPGFAHGFMVLSERADFLYKTTDYYLPEYEHCILWNDPELNIDWPLDEITPSLSDRDKRGVLFKDAETYL